MGGRHTYGTSLFCISRRLFVMAFCLVMTVLSIFAAFQWLRNSAAVNILLGTRYVPGNGCSGMACYEVFSCYGMGAATLHLREPFSTIGGLIFYPVGLWACHHGYRAALQAFALFVLFMAVWHLGILVADIIYQETCGRYPANEVLAMVLNPLVAIFPAAKVQLLQMDMYTVKAVDTLTEFKHLTVWYLVLGFIKVLVLFYAAYESVGLGLLMERGPLGLGLHYGIIWDESLSEEAIARRRDKKSKFLSDAEVHEAKNVEGSPGFAVHPHYGAMEHHPYRHKDFKVLHHVHQRVMDKQEDELAEEIEP